MPDLQRAPGGLPVPARWSTPQLAALCLIAGIVVVVGWLLRQPDVMAGGDDTVYLLLAKSLAAGQYRDIFLAGAPPHVKYPPGMPLWLAAVESTGLGLPAMQFGQLIMLAATALLVADALRRLQAPWLGVVAAAVIGWNPTLLELAGIMYSEMLFTLLFTLCLWALLRVEQSDCSRRGHEAIVVAILAAAAAFLTRTAGLAVLTTVPLVLLLRRRWWPAALAALIGVVLIAGWTAHVTSATESLAARSYVADLALAPLDSTPGGLAGRAVANVRSYIVTISVGTLGLPGIPHNPIDNLIWTVVLGGGAVLGCVFCLRRWSAVPIVMVAYGAILLAWPWPLFRLAVPFVPVGIAAMLLGAAWPVSQPWPPLMRFLPLTSLLTVLGLGVMNGNMGRARAVAQCSRVDAWRAPSPCAPPREHALVAVARSARGALPHGSVIATSKESVVFHFSGHQTISFKALDYALPSVPAAMAAASATHLLLARMNPAEERNTGPRVGDSCAELTAVVASDGPAVLLAPRLDGDPDACEAIRRVLEWEEVGEANGERRTVNGER